MTRILGIDPGSRLTGYGLIGIDTIQPLARPVYLTSGRIRLQGDTMADRLAQLYDSLSALFVDNQPDEVALEQVFLGKNVSSALKLGQARGIAMLIPAKHGLPLYEYAPRAIKQAVAGTGAADKTQVQDMVVTLLGLDGRPTEDASDALAAALCHAHQRQHSVRSGNAEVAKSQLVEPYL